MNHKRFVKKLTYTLVALETITVRHRLRVRRFAAMTVNYRGIAVTRVCPLETPRRETRRCFIFSSASLCRENYSRRIKGIARVCVYMCVCVYVYLRVCNDAANCLLLPAGICATYNRILWVARYSAILFWCIIEAPRNAHFPFLSFCMHSHDGNLRGASSRNASE